MDTCRYLGHNCSLHESIFSLLSVPIYLPGRDENPSQSGIPTFDSKRETIYLHVNLAAYLLHSDDI